MCIICQLVLVLVVLCCVLYNMSAKPVIRCVRRGAAVGSARDSVSAHACIPELTRAGVPCREQLACSVVVAVCPHPPPTCM